MSQMIEVKVPDIGDYTDVPVIDVCVKAGDVVKVDDALVTLESDKATMDVPSSAAGVVKEAVSYTHLEGINEAGAMSDWIAAATAYSVHGTHTIPFYICH